MGQLSVKLKVGEVELHRVFDFVNVLAHPFSPFKGIRIIIGEKASDFDSEGAAIYLDMDSAKKLANEILDSIKKAKGALLMGGRRGDR